MLYKLENICSLVEWLSEKRIMQAADKKWYYAELTDGLHLVLVANSTKELIENYLGMQPK